MVDQKMDPALREVFRQAYTFRQKYQNPSRSPQFWRNAAGEMAILVHQCNNHPFARGMLLACYADIERELLEREPDPEQVKLLL